MVLFGSCSICVEVSRMRCNANGVSLCFQSAILSETAFKWLFVGQSIKNTRLRNEHRICLDFFYKSVGNAIDLR